MSNINEPSTKEEKAQISDKKSARVPLKIIAHDDGALEITYANGKVKKRKGQLEEEYQKELEQFRSEGPKINTENWMIDLFNEQYNKYSSTIEEPSETSQEILKSLPLFNVTDRLQKFQLLRIAENQYYKRNYEKCVLICDTLLVLLRIFLLEKASKKELEEVELIKKHCFKKVDVAS